MDETKDLVEGSTLFSSTRVLEVQDRYFLYDCSVNRIFEIDYTTAHILKSCSSSGRADLTVDHKIIEKFGLREVQQRLDFFREPLAQRRMMRPYRLVFTAAQNFRVIPRTLEFVVTGGCNLSCQYCATQDRYVSPHGVYDMMSEGTALKAIDLLRRFHDGGPLLVKFFGGEPLLGMNVIRRVMSSLSEIGIESENMIATNGLLLDEDAVNFLAEHRFLTFLSLDGCSQIHDKNRKDKNGHGTYEKVVEKLRMIQALQPEYFSSYVAINMVVSPENSSSYSENVDHLISLGIAHNQIHPSDTEPTRELCTHYNARQLNSVRKEKSRLRNEMIKSIFDGKNRERNKCHESYCQFKPDTVDKDGFQSFLEETDGDCISLTDCQSQGWNIITILPDGKISACIEFKRTDSLTFGDLEKNEISLEKISAFQTVFRNSVANGRCESCWAVRFCSYTGCYKIFANYACQPGWQQEEICEATRNDLQDKMEDYLRLKIRKDNI